MRKTPAYLKGLAETRARAAGDVKRLTCILNDVEKELATATKELESCDTLIKKLDERLNPTQINPIHQQVRYKQHGALQEFIKEYLLSIYPENATAPEIALKVQLKFGLHFDHHMERNHWQHNSVYAALKKLRNYNILERCNTPSEAVSRWRWRTEAPLSLGHLQALAADSDVTVRLSDDVHA